MIRKKLIFTILVLFSCFSLWSSFILPTENRWSSKTPLYQILEAFGETLPDHARNNADETTIKRGYDLIHYGRTIGPNGKKSKYISKFYACTSCHNQQREDPHLVNLDPQKRLEYALANDLKFLQGSTFYGIANRETWYNDDYYLKYGDLVQPAMNSLAKATQLCATVCSSGRLLLDWELEAILAYYWNNQLTLGDLALDELELTKVLKTPASERPEMIKMLKSKYSQKSPANFGKVPDDKSLGYSLKGDAENGKAIYRLSCLACHQKEGVAGMTLTPNQLTFRKFKKNLTKEGVYNIYDIVRIGTYTDQGKPRYMPHYTKDRMSNQQIEDLRSYILEEAN